MVWAPYAKPPADCDLADPSANVRIHFQCPGNVEPGFAPNKTFANRCHDVYFAGILGFSFLKALVVNSWRDPKYFALQLKMIARFIGWRFLGKSRNGEI